MPEGPEVETVRRSLEPQLVGRTLGRPRVSRKPLRTPSSSQALRVLEGRRVVALGRHGKLMWIDVDGGAGLLVRLGMSGKLLVVDAGARVEPHTHVTIPVEGRELRYVDHRRFGEVVPFQSPVEREAERARMGPDGLSLDDAGRARVGRALLKTRRALKDALLDQAVVAGVGNIYASEILWLAQLSPFRAASSLREAELAALLAATSTVLAQAVSRRGTSFSNYVDGTGVPGDNLDYLAVFQRDGEPCPRCKKRVVRGVQGRRSTFFCRTCQPKRTVRRADVT